MQVDMARVHRDRVHSPQSLWTRSRAIYCITACVRPVCTYSMAVMEMTQLIGSLQLGPWCKVSVR